MGKKRGRPVINDPEKSRDYYVLKVKLNKQEKESLDLTCRLTGYSKSKTVRVALSYAYAIEKLCRTPCVLGGLTDDQDK